MITVGATLFALFPLAMHDLPPIWTGGRSAPGRWSSNPGAVSIACESPWIASRRRCRPWRFSPSLLLFALFVSRVPEMIVPYAEAAAVMLANAAPGGAMSRKRVGIALPAGMPGRKDRWTPRPRRPDPGTAPFSARGSTI
jgi:hypothetical protein